jgi:hypothetical protein
VEILKLVPLLYYDLISRVVPGMMLMVFLPLSLNRSAWAIWQNGTAVGQGDSMWIFLLLALSTGYIAGQMLAPISDMLERRIAAALFSSSYAVLRQAALAHHRSPFPAIVCEFVQEKLRERGIQPKEASRQDYEMLLFQWYDAVRLDSPDLAGRLTKMRAEYRMYSGISAASLLAVIAHLFLRALHLGPVNAAFISIGVVSCLLGLWGTVRMYKMFQVSVISHYYIRRTK